MFTLAHHCCLFLCQPGTTWYVMGGTCGKGSSLLHDKQESKDENLCQGVNNPFKDKPQYPNFFSLDPTL